MFGILFDVSDSMKEAFSEYHDKCSGLTDENVKKTHGIITTLNNIVNQEITTYERKDLVFVTAFGLNDSNSNSTSHPTSQQQPQLLPVSSVSNSEDWDSDCTESVDTCDFVALLKEKNEIDRRLLEYSSNGHKILIEFAQRKNASHVEPWIKEKLDQKDAGILWESLKDDDDLTEKILNLIPGKGICIATQTLEDGTRQLGMGLEVVAGMLGLDRMVSVAHTVQTSIDNRVDNHEALILARNVIKKRFAVRKILQKVQNTKTHLAKDVSTLMDNLLQENKDASSSRVHEIIDSIQPYIYGRTPMVKALKEAKEIFDSNPEINPKVLFILSDGKATDTDLGDPISIAQELQNSNVTIVTCYFTSESIPNPKRLVDKAASSWSEGECVLYNMSSTMPNTNVPVTHLIDYDWKLPLSGQCHLFLRANSLDVVEEFCKVVVSHLTHGTDAVVHMLGRLSLNTYINQENNIDSKKVPEQEGATCYANAIATVFHLAMKRIVGREVPDFETIRDRIIRQYGKEGANTERVIEKVCPEYRLRCHKKIREKRARQALNERRPVVARFSFKDEQQEIFEKFYARSPKAILRASDIAVEESSQIVGGHAVVLIRCHPNCLVFMNTWGQEFADGGFFRVQDEKVLHNMQFFDIYWEEDDLTTSEKEAFDKKGVDEWKAFLEKFKSIQEITYACPHCKEKSKVDEFTGHHLEARCPKCQQTFKPDGNGLMECLYLHSR